MTKESMNQDAERARMVSFGYSAFMAASKIAPASAAAQAAHIARTCKIAGEQNPRLVGFVLMNDEEIVGRILSTAKRVHAHRNVEAEVTRQGVRGIIRTDFYDAAQLMSLSLDDLQHIYTELYSHYGVTLGDRGVRNAIKAHYGINLS